MALWSNQLSGPIPESIGNLPALERLDLSSNGFSGPIPEFLGQMSGLTELGLSYNNFSGEIPDTLKNLTHLTSLRLEQNNLSGKLPEWLGNFTDLYNLVLGRNDFYGAVPDTLRNLSNLTYLDVSFNRFDYLPDLSALTPTLAHFYVRNNLLTFEDIESNMVISGLAYAPQADVGEGMDSTLVEGDSISFSVEVGGSANHYQWYKDGTELPGDTLSVYEISPAALSDSGSYTCQITNDIVSGLTLKSLPFVVHVKSSTGVQDNGSLGLPQKYVLRQNYPNPFNPSTIINYELPITKDVTLVVYNALGQKVRTLVNKRQEAGKYALTFDASALSSGIYYYKLSTGNFVQIRKMIYMK